MEPEGSLPHLKVPAICPYPELNIYALYKLFKFFLLTHKGSFSLNHVHIALNKTRKYTHIIEKPGIIKFNCGQTTR